MMLVITARWLTFVCLVLPSQFVFWFSFRSTVLSKYPCTN